VSHHLSRRRFIFLSSAAAVAGLTPRLSARTTGSDIPDLFLRARFSRRVRSLDPIQIGEELVLNADALSSPFVRLRIGDRDQVLVRSSIDASSVQRLSLEDTGLIGSLRTEGDLVFGSVYFPGGEASAIRSNGRATWYEPLDRSRVSECGGTRQPLAATAATTARPSRRRAAMPPSPQPITLRLALYYTDDALLQAPKLNGDQVLFEQWLRSRVDLFNSIAAASGVPWVSYQIAKIRRLAYKESIDQDTNLAWISSDKQVAAWRGEDRADVVALVTWQGGNLANCPSAAADFTPDWGFATFSVYGAESGITDCHEMGHPLGLDHDAGTLIHEGRQVPPGFYREAIIFPPSTEETLMGRYQDSSGLFYRRIPRFSNPDLTYKGVPAGSASANNALGLREGALLVAQYRNHL
jgi:hypothetical protein